MKRVLLALALLAAPAAIPVFAAVEQETVWNPAISGLETVDVTIYLDREDPLTEDDLADQSVAGITIAEVGSTGRYHVQGMPGVDPDQNYNYHLSVCYGGSCWAIAYPPRTLSAANIVWGNLVAISRNRNEFAVGATTPDIGLEVSGLGQNPTGGTVTFTVTSLDGQTTVINAAAASISGITETVDEDTGVSTWAATLLHDTSATLTATAGNYIGRFKLTFGDGEILFLPIARRLTIEVIR